MQIRRALARVAPILSRAQPPASVPTIPARTVTTPNVRSAVRPGMLKTSLPALGPQKPYAPITAATANFNFRRTWLGPPVRSQAIDKSTPLMQRMTLSRSCVRWLEAAAGVVSLLASLPHSCAAKHLHEKDECMRVLKALTFSASLLVMPW